MTSSPASQGFETPLGPVERILAIRFARLGDVALLLPALFQLRAMYPDAHLALMTGTPSAGLARLCPELDEVIAVDRLAMRDGPKFRAGRDIFNLVRSVRSERYDLVIDFHSFRETNLLAWLSRARFRLGMKRADRVFLSFCFNLEPVLEDKSLHVAEMFRRVVGGLPGSVAVSPEISGPLISVPGRVSEDVSQRYVRMPVRAPILAVYAGASVASRRWPSSRFAAIADHAASEWGATVLVLTGESSGEREIGEEIAGSVRGTTPLRLLSGLEIRELAAAIGLARLLVSNDTGPMHIGPLMGIPTLGIFSRSLPEHYRPIGPGDRYVRGDPVDRVTTEEVIEAMEEMWS